MNLIIGLFVLGVFLVALEVILPGGIIGIIGGLAIIAGIVVSYDNYGTEGALTATAVALCFGTLVLYFEFKILPKTRLGGRLFLKRNISGKSQADVASDDAIGQTCETLTDLAPTGLIRLDGRKVEAASRSGFIEKGESVKVVAKENFRLIVSKP